MDPDASREPEAGERTGVVVMGASAGGLSALTSILSMLPESFAVPILVVMHLAPSYHSQLPELLARRTRLRVVEACDGAVLEPGVGYVAPPDEHLTVGKGGVTFAHDRKTSGNFGMLGAAVQLGAASSVLPIGQIASALMRLLGASASSP